MIVVSFSVCFIICVIGTFALPTLTTPLIPGRIEAGNHNLSSVTTLTGNYSEVPHLKRYTDGQNATVNRDSSVPDKLQASDSNASSQANPVANVSHTLLNTSEDSKLYGTSQNYLNIDNANKSAYGMDTIANASASKSLATGLILTATKNGTNANNSMFREETHEQNKLKTKMEGVRTLPSLVVPPDQTRNNPQNELSKTNNPTASRLPLDVGTSEKRPKGKTSHLAKTLKAAARNSKKLSEDDTFDLGPMEEDMDGESDKFKGVNLAENLKFQKPLPIVPSDNRHETGSDASLFKIPSVSGEYILLAVCILLVLLLLLWKRCWYLICNICTKQRRHRQSENGSGRYKIAYKPL